MFHLVYIHKKRSLIRISLLEIQKSFFFYIFVSISYFKNFSRYENLFSHYENQERPYSSNLRYKVAKLIPRRLAACFFPLVEVP